MWKLTKTLKIYLEKGNINSFPLCQFGKVCYYSLPDEALMTRYWCLQDLEYWLQKVVLFYFNTYADFPESWLQYMSSV